MLPAVFYRIYGLGFKRYNHAMEKAPIMEAEEQPIEVPEKELGAFSTAVQRDLAEHVLEKMPDAKKKRSYLRLLAQSVAAVVVGLVINHAYQFRDKVHESKAGAGHEWTHSDKETEHILNVFSGKEQFNATERNYIARYMTIKWCKKNSVPVPNSIQEWDMQKIGEFYRSQPKELGGLFQFEYISKWALKQSFFMKRLHDELWRIERSCGSPHVRWQDSDHDLFMSNQYHRANYNALNNTVYIDPEDIGLRIYEQFVSEVAHAEQFKDAPASTLSSATADIVRSAARAVINGTDFGAEYMKLYDDPKSFEYDAHNKREPALKKKVQDAVDKDVSEKYNTYGRDHY